MKKYALIALLALVLSPVATAQKKGNDTRIPYANTTEVDFSGENLSTAQLAVANIVSQVDASQVDTTTPPPKKVTYWSKGLLTQVGLSQVSLTNWAAGGFPTISLNGLIDGTLDYNKDKFLWENRLKISYGFIQTFDATDLQNNPFSKQFKKSDDRITLDSKFGYQLVERLYFSTALNFRSQLTNTFEGDKLKSTILAPGYLSLGVGLKYKPLTWLSLNFTPLTGNLVIVTMKDLQETYGNVVKDRYGNPVLDEEGNVKTIPVRAELGLQFKLEAKKEWKIFKAGTELTIFSDYIAGMKNVQIYWDVDLALQVAKFFTITLNTNLIYDNLVMVRASEEAKKAAQESGEAVKNDLPGVQFKEVLGISFTYTFGTHRK